MGKRENQVALREREAEVKALERHNQTLEKELESLRNQKGDRDAEIKQLREALLEKRSTSEKKAGSDLSAAIAERDRLALELSQLRAIALQGSKEDGKVDAVARAALEEFDKIKAARKADKERWKSEKEDLMKRLESLESDLKQQASAVAKVMQLLGAPLCWRAKRRIFAACASAEEEG
ncbi:hypothetical protein DFJ74DRAFT_172859 [Hyaloraphidium curvatum]|nr:hypothetical protein DFJ74DRAFT_172859 [Hyaloraphidium curvatum]